MPGEPGIGATPRRIRDAAVQTSRKAQERGTMPVLGPAPKPTSWVYFMVDLEDMPSSCPHPMRRWHCDIDTHLTTLARHPPSKGTAKYSLRPFSALQKRAQPRLVLPEGKRYSSARMAAYPDLLNRYLVAKIQMAVYSAPRVANIRVQATTDKLARTAEI